MNKNYKANMPSFTADVVLARKAAGLVSRHPFITRMGSPAATASFVLPAFEPIISESCYEFCSKFASDNFCRRLCRLTL
jgi:hypothetical protein